MGRGKLAIIGRGPGFEKGLEGRPEVTLWAPSSAYLQLIEKGFVLQPGDKIFQLHKPEVFENWLFAIQENLVLMRPFDGLPEAEILQKDFLVDLYGRKFSSSISWMVALAMNLGFDEIGFYGIDLDHETEYKTQRDSFFYFLGRAEEAGIKISIPRYQKITLDDCYMGD